jgi:hypothetical protein
MFSHLVPKFLRLREDFMGPKEAMTNHPGMTNNGGKSHFAPTYFETLGQNSVKANRCYSASMTHQHPRSLVGPTAGGKVYEDGEMHENITLRKRVLEVSLTFITSLKKILKLFQKLNAEAAMIVLREFLPKSELELLDENSHHNNLPRIGSDDNTAFPGGQINLAAAVKHADSLCESNIYGL